MTTATATAGTCSGSIVKAICGELEIRLTRTLKTDHKKYGSIVGDPEIFIPDPAFRKVLDPVLIRLQQIFELKKKIEEKLPENCVTDKYIFVLCNVQVIFKRNSPSLAWIRI